MKASLLGYNVAVVGAASLLGKELESVLEERKFPVARRVNFDADNENPDSPILDLGGGSEGGDDGDELSHPDVDFAFLAARPKTLPAFLRPTRKDPAGAADGTSRCIVIDVGDTLAEVPGLAASAPRLGAMPPAAGEAPSDPRSRFIVSAHPAAIVVGRLLLSLAARFEVKLAVAEVFVPASNWGPSAIEELQKQTVNLLSFQPIPRSVFGRQLAFNLLPRFGSARSPGWGRSNRLGRSGRSGALGPSRPSGRAGLEGLEAAIRHQVRQLLADRAPAPALRLIQPAVFYSLALSLYVELGAAAPAEEIATALTEESAGAGGRLRLRGLSEPAPSPVDAAGSEEILVDAIVPDAGRPGGIWLWATVDNLRLAAENAVEIAEHLQSRISHRDPKVQ